MKGFGGKAYKILGPEDHQPTRLYEKLPKSAKHKKLLKDRVRSTNGARRNRSKYDPEAASWLAACSGRLSVRSALSPADERLGSLIHTLPGSRGGGYGPGVRRASLRLLRTKCKHTLLCGSTPLPNCNYKFLFRISPDFISSETSRVTFEFYVVAYIKDILVGSVCFILSSCPTTVKASVGTPAFIVAQIQRRSERFHDVLRVRATVYGATKFDLAMMNGVSATIFHRLNVEEIKPHPPSSTPERHQIEGNP
nr:BON1-associated protein 2 [Ipomoea batatas]